MNTAALASRLTMSGIEVESIEPAAGDFQGVVVGEVLSVEQHPGADKLTVCQVAAGGAANLQVVCGAPNVRAGMKAPLALEGARLAAGEVIRKARLRGVESSGMLCSARELGLSDEHEGIFELPDELVTGYAAAGGAPARRHDPDAQCDPESRRRAVGARRRPGGRRHLVPQAVPCAHGAGAAGNAREICGEARVASRLPAVREPCDSGRQSGCPHAALDARAPAPRGTASDPSHRRRHELRDARARPAAARLRPASAAPAHRSAQCPCRRAPEASRRPRTRAPTDTLVIADAAGPVGLAGIMGGEKSGIAVDTSDVFLEGAFFPPDVVAGVARRYGLVTDAAQRFERGVDPRGQERAIERATQLLVEIAGGRPGPAVLTQDDAHQPRRPGVTLRPERVTSLLGVQVPRTEIEDILRRLGMQVAGAGDVLGVFRRATASTSRSSRTSSRKSPASTATTTSRASMRGCRSVRNPRRNAP